MRPIEHVLICACAATALSAAAAHAGSEEGYYTIKLTNASIASSSGPTREGPDHFLPLVGKRHRQHGHGPTDL